MKQSEVTTAQVAAEVRAWLARRQLSANQAAPMLGWSQTYLSRRLTGAREFSVQDLIALGALLGVDPAVFFSGPGPDDWTSPVPVFQRAGGTPAGRSRRPGFSMPRSPATVAA